MALSTRIPPTSTVIESPLGYDQPRAYLITAPAGRLHTVVVFFGSAEPLGRARSSDTNL